MCNKMWRNVLCLQEYERQESEESRFVKDADKLDMILQAFEYEQSHDKPGFLHEFFNGVDGMLY